MEDLLVLAQIESENRFAAEHQLKEKIENDPIKSVSELIQVISNFHSDFRALSLGSIILFQIMRNLSIESNGTDIFFEVSQKALNLISYPNDNVSQSAAQLFAISVSPLIRTNKAPDILNEISSKINPENDQRIVHFLIVAIEGILTECDLEREQTLPIFHSILSLQALPFFFHDILKALTSLIDSFPIIASDESIYEQIFNFVIQIIKQSEYKYEAYNFWYILSKSSSIVFENFLEIILNQIYEDLQNPEQIPEAALTCLNMVIKRIAKMQHALQKLYINAERFVEIVDLLISLRLMTTPDLHPCEEQWGVFQSTENSIAWLCKAIGDKSGEYLLQKISQILSETLNEQTKELSIFLARVAGQESFCLTFDVFMEILSVSFTDESNIRVIFECLITIINFSQQNEKGLETEQIDTFLELLEPIVSLCQNDDEHLVALSLNALAYLSVFSKEKQGSILEIILSNIVENNEIVSNAATDSLEVFFNKTESMNLACEAIPVLLQFLEQTYNSDIYVTNILDSILFCVETAKISVSDYSEVIFAHLINAIHENDIVKDILCAVSGYSTEINPELIKIVSESIIEALKNAEDEETFTQICINIRDVLANNSFCDYLNFIAKILIEKMQNGGIYLTNSVSTLSRIVELYPNTVADVIEVLMEHVCQYFNSFDQTASDQNVSAHICLLTSIIITNPGFYEANKELVFGVFVICKNNAINSEIICSDIMDLFCEIIKIDTESAKSFVESSSDIFDLIAASNPFPDCYESRHEILFLMNTVGIDVSIFGEISESDDEEEIE